MLQAGQQERLEQLYHEMQDLSQLSDTATDILTNRGGGGRCVRTNVIIINQSTLGQHHYVQEQIISSESSDELLSPAVT